MAAEASLPYIEPDGTHTQGWSGSEASHERALADVKTGRVMHRQAQALRHLADVGSHGATWSELADTFGMHHGQASSVLSTLHKDGRIACLRDRRGRSHIYVDLRYVDGRLTRKPGRTAAARATEEDLAAQFKAGHEAGELIGQAEGWRSGYDDGMEAARQEYARSNEWMLIRAEGYDAGRAETATQFGLLAAQMRRAMPNRVVFHNDRCWMEHPECAMDSVLKAVTRIVGDAQRSTDRRDV